jgi:hypothetical protein
MKCITVVVPLCLAIVANNAPSQVRSHSAPVSNGFSIPKEGFVPTADVAISIAEAVLVPVYGKERILSERPFRASLEGQIWFVTGTVPCRNPPPGAECPGGAAEVRISKKTGQILFMIHTM